MAIERNEPGAPAPRLPGSDVAASRNGQGEPATPLLRSDKFEVRIVPDDLEVRLRPLPAPPVPGRSTETERNRSGWHHVVPRPGFLVSLTSLDGKLRRVRLTVRSRTSGWRPRWVRWSFASRTVSELLGGDAVSAQDLLHDDDRELTLLLLPGERREATLGFDVALDGETRPGEYLFDITGTDVEEADEADMTAGRLFLRHPEPALLRYLPGIYREARCPCDDAEEGFPDLPFFQRFLLGFEDGIAPLRALIDNMDRFFGPNTAPPDFLPWLATWASLALDENWPEMKHRRLIREAAELYRWRGTRRGLSRYLEIYTEVTPEINDQPFAGMRLGESTLLGRDTTLGDVPVHTFVVTLAVPDTAAINEQIVRDIIETQKPAHTGYALRIVRRAASDSGTVEGAA